MILVWVYVYIVAKRNEVADQLAKIKIRGRCIKNWRYYDLTGKYKKEGRIRSVEQSIKKNIWKGERNISRDFLAIRTSVIKRREDEEKKWCKGLLQWLERITTTLINY